MSETRTRPPTKDGQTFSFAIPALRLKQLRPERHPIVKLDYLFRLVACVLASATAWFAIPREGGRITVGAGHGDAPLVVLGLLLFYALVWPHVAFWLGTVSQDSKRTELGAILFDSFCLGAFSGLSHFNPMPSIMFFTCINAANLSLGGLRFALFGLLSMVSGAAASVLYAGFHVNLEASPLTNLLASLALAAFTSMFGFLSFIQTRRLLKARQEMREQKQKIEEQKNEVEQARQAAENERTSAEEARETAVSANKAKSAFLANMSHELRTPLNAIIGYSELLQEEAIDAGHEEMIADLKKICDAGKHLLRLINSVLDLSKIEAGKMDLFIETFDIEMLVSEVASTAEPLVAKNSNRFLLKLAPELGNQKGDVTKLKQILLNLIGNAAKFTEKGTVTLDVRKDADYDGNWLVFDVVDNGIGMKPEQLGKLFQAFTQADAATTRKYGGTGLGLVLARRFCQMMGGNVTVKSEFNKGTTFTVKLPTDVANPEGDATSIHRIDSRMLLEAAERLRQDAERRKLAAKERGDA